MEGFDICTIVGRIRVSSEFFDELYEKGVTWCCTQEAIGDFETSSVMGTERDKEVAVESGLKNVEGNERTKVNVNVESTVLIQIQIAKEV